ncbi:MAG: YcbK family protein [Vicinamibacterales bacterium]
MRHLSRRTFIASVAAAVPALGLPRPLLAQSGGGRELHFFHTHTAERLIVEYHDGRGYLADALAAVNRFLRDFRTGDEHEIDPGLLDLLHRLAGVTGTARPFEVISGYRSPATNQMLRLHSEGVAAGSLHMQGMAIDVRLPDVPLVALRKAALAVHGGGVGYYPASRFVHVDTGRVRAW